MVRVGAPRAPTRNERPLDLQHHVPLEQHAHHAAAVAREHGVGVRRFAVRMAVGDEPIDVQRAVARRVEVPLGVALRRLPVLGGGVLGIRADVGADDADARVHAVIVRLERGHAVPEPRLRYAGPKRDHLATSS